MALCRTYLSLEEVDYAEHLLIVFGSDLRTGALGKVPRAVLVAHFPPPGEMVHLVYAHLFGKLALLVHLIIQARNTKSRHGQKGKVVGTSIPCLKLRTFETTITKIRVFSTACSWCFRVGEYTRLLICRVCPTTR